MIVSAIKTKLFYPKSKIVRFPFDVRGKQFIDFGAGLSVGFNCRIEAYPPNDKDIVLNFGKDVQINDYVHITAMGKVSIGNNVLIASKVYISDCSHGSYAGDEFDSSPASIPKDRLYLIKEVIIEDNVWLGEHVSILPGVHIGKGTIVGANAVVTKDLPANVIAAGIPARAIKKFNFDTGRWEVI